MIAPSPSLRFDVFAAACLFACAYRCHRFRGEAAFGNDTLPKQTFYSFRVHT
jgi:hypothetical protein